MTEQKEPIVYKEILLTRGQSTIVDVEDYEWLNKFNWHGGVYATRKEVIEGKRTTIYMHKEIMNVDSSSQVDHINLNKKDNRKMNLRKCSKAENSRNTLSRENSSSHHKGVSWDGELERWKVQLKANGVVQFFKYFTNEIAAANAYNYYATLHHKEFARLNKVDYMDQTEWEEYIYTNETYSKYRGVTWDKKRSLWVANAEKQNKNYHAGGFTNEESAAIAYNELASKIHGEKAILNEVVYDENWTQYKVQKLKKSSIHNGVTHRQKEDRWVATIRFNGNHIYIGYYKTEIDAAIAYNQKAQELFGEMAILNNI